MDPRAGRLDEVLRRLAAAGRLGRVEVRTEDVLWNLNEPAAHRRALRRIRG